MNLNTRIVVFNGDPTTFNAKNMDASDAIAVVGNVRDIYSFMDPIDHDAAVIAQGHFLEGAVETTEYRGQVIPSDPDIYKQTAPQDLQADVATNTAYTILHGAGHISKNGPEGHTKSSDAVLMWDGNFQESNNKNLNIGGVKGLLNNKIITVDGVNHYRNSVYITDMKKGQFGNDEARDDYNANANLNSFNPFFWQTRK